MREEGSVLLLVLLVVAIILTLSTSLAVVVGNEIKMTSYNEDRVKAGYKAEAGVEEAINMINNDPFLTKGLNNDEPVYSGKLETENDFVINEINWKEDNDLYQNLYQIKATGRTPRTDREIKAEVEFKTSSDFQHLFNYDSNHGDLKVKEINLEEILFGEGIGTEFEEKIKSEVNDFKDRDKDEDEKHKILDIKFKSGNYVKKIKDYIIYKNGLGQEIYIEDIKDIRNIKNMNENDKKNLLYYLGSDHDKIVYKNENGKYINARTGEEVSVQGDLEICGVIYKYKISKDDDAKKIYKGLNGNYYYLGKDKSAFISNSKYQEYQADVEDKIADYYFQTQYDFKKYANYSWLDSDIELPAGKITYINGDLELINLKNSIKSDQEKKPAIVVVNGDLTIGTGINEISDIIFIQNGDFKNVDFDGLIKRSFIYTEGSTTIATAASDFSGSVISEKDLSITTYSSDFEEIIEELKATFKYNEVNLWNASPIFKDESKDKFFDLKVISWDERKTVD